MLNCKFKYSDLVKYYYNKLEFSAYLFSEFYTLSDYSWLTLKYLT